MESITFTNRIIRFHRGTETIIVYCPPPLFPLNDGISLLLLQFRGKRESLGERERERADTGQSSTAATSRRAADQTVRSNSRSLDPCWNHLTIRAYTLQWRKGRGANSVKPCTQSSPAAAPSQHCSSSLKAGTRKNDIKPPRFSGPWLYLSWNWKLHLAQKLQRKNRRGKRGGVHRACALKAHFCSNLAENMLELPLTPFQLEIVMF